MKNQPYMEVPASKPVKVMNFLALTLIIGTLVYVGFSYRSLPETIPMHFNLKGEADGWGNKGVIFLPPLITLIPFMVLYFLSKSPDTYNFPVKVTEENAPRLYREARLMMTIFNLEMAAVMSYLSWSMVQAAKGNTGLDGWFIPITIAVFLVTIIISVIRMRSLK